MAVQWQIFKNKLALHPPSFIHNWLQESSLLNLFCHGWVTPVTFINWSPLNLCQFFCRKKMRGIFFIYLYLFIKALKHKCWRSVLSAVYIATKWLKLRAAQLSTGCLTWVYSLSVATRWLHSFWLLYNHSNKANVFIHA